MMYPPFIALLFLLCSTITPSLVSAATPNCVSSCHHAFTAHKYKHEPVKNNECLDCHVQKIKEHPFLNKSGKSFDLKAKVPELCFGCHDRIGLKMKVAHPPVKKGDCLACHKIHGASGNKLLDIQGDDQSTLCFTCHDPKGFKHKYEHGPVAVGECTSCHEPHESAEKSLLKLPSRDLCLKCHADFAEGIAKASIVHPPVRDKACTTCHVPHSSEVQFILKSKLPTLCTDCHTKIANSIKGVKTVHKPINEEQSCHSCHGSHYSNNKALLPANEMDTCLKCHNTDKLGKLRNIEKEVVNQKQIHGPIMKNTCGGCHTPHGSNHPALLTGAYPADFYAPYKEGTYEICLKCHDKNLLRFAETTLYTRFRNGNRNLHYLHVIMDKRKGRSCKACHETHGSQGKRLINDRGPQFGAWKVPINLKITPTGGSCSPGCHRTFHYDRNKPVDYSKVTFKPDPAKVKELDQSAPSADKPAPVSPAPSAPAPSAATGIVPALPVNKPAPAAAPATSPNEVK